MAPLFRWIVAGVFLVSGPFAMVGAWEGWQTWREVRDAVRAVGTVVENRLVTDRRDGRDEQAYLPVVEFRGSDGAVTRFTDGVGSLPPEHAVGERVEVAFRAGDPGSARLTSWTRLWLAPAILVAVGLLPGVICAACLWRIARRAR